MGFGIEKHIKTFESFKNNECKLELCKLLNILYDKYGDFAFEKINKQLYGVELGSHIFLSFDKASDNDKSWEIISVNPYRRNDIENNKRSISLFAFLDSDIEVLYNKLLSIVNIKKIFKKINEEIQGEEIIEFNKLIDTLNSIENTKAFQRVNDNLKDIYFNRRDGIEEESQSFHLLYSKFISFKKYERGNNQVWGFFYRDGLGGEKRFKKLSSTKLYVIKKLNKKIVSLVNINKIFKKLNESNNGEISRDVILFNLTNLLESVNFKNGLLDKLNKSLDGKGVMNDRFKEFIKIRNTWNVRIWEDQDSFLDEEVYISTRPISGYSTKFIKSLYDLINSLINMNKIFKIINK